MSLNPGNPRSPRMKLSFTTMATPELSVWGQAQAAKRFGFDAVDLRMARDQTGEIPPDATAAQLARLRDAAGPVSSLLCYNKRIQAGADEMAASVLHHMAIAQALSVPNIRIFTGLLEDSAEKQVCGLLERVLAEGAEDVGILIQNHRGSSATAAQAARICQALQTPRLGLALSPDHTLYMGEELPLAAVLPHTRQLYIVGNEPENRGEPPAHLRPSYTRLLRELKERDFDGYLTFKWERCWNPALASFETVFPQFVDWIGGFL